MAGKRALILGITGQDGAYLARFLHGRGYEVHGTSRSEGTQSSNLHRLHLEDKVSIHTLSVLDGAKGRELIEAVRPSEIYYLAGQASVNKSFLHPVGLVLKMRIRSRPRHP